MGLRKRSVGSGFWAGGRRELVAALTPQIREDVSKEYATRLKSSGPVGRFFLKRRMNREIKKRIRQQASLDAHY